MPWRWAGLHPPHTSFEGGIFLSGQLIDLCKPAKNYRVRHFLSIGFYKQNAPLLDYWRGVGGSSGCQRGCSRAILQIAAQPGSTVSGPYSLALPGFLIPRAGRPRGCCTFYNSKNRVLCKVFLGRRSRSVHRAPFSHLPRGAPSVPARRPRHREGT